MHFLIATVATDAARPKIRTILIKITVHATLLTAAVGLVWTVSRLFVAMRLFVVFKVLFEMLADLAAFLWFVSSLHHPLACSEWLLIAGGALGSTTQSLPHSSSPLSRFFRQDSELLRSAHSISTRVFGLRLFVPTQDSI